MCVRWYRFGLLLSLIFCIGWLAVGMARAQSGNYAAIADFEIRVAEWERTLREAQALIDAPWRLRDGTGDDIQTKLAAIDRDGSEFAASLKHELSQARALVETLGPPPSADAPEEPKQIQRTRAEIAERINSLDGRVKRLDLLLGLTAQAVENLVEVRRSQIQRQLFDRYPSPLRPDVILRALADFARVLGTIVSAPFVYVSQDLDGERWKAAAPSILLAFLLSVGLGWGVRGWLARRFGRDSNIEAPTPGQKVLAELAVVICDGALPALMILVPIWVIQAEQLATGLSGGTLVALATMTARFLLVTAFLKAALAPEDPKWRVHPFADDSAQQAYRVSFILMAVLHTALFLAEAMKSVDAGRELTATFVFAVTVLMAFNTLALLRPNLWRTRDDGQAIETETAADETLTGDEEPPFRATTLWSALRWLARAIAIIAPLAAAAGYTELGTFLFVRIVDIAIVVGVLFFVRGYLREATSVALQEDGRANIVTRRLLGQEQTGLERLNFWLHLALDALFMLASVAAIMVMLGMSPTALWDSIVRGFRGFTFGTVTISPANILSGVIVFAVFYIATRLLQRLLVQRVWPRTQIDAGVGHSVSAGLGYVGIAIAAVAGVATIGLDLSNLALIFGALSVGIGFGLQNIVNNFAAGLILLIERPVKVGDWVKLGDLEGTVRRINVRSTEIQTFQRASVIVPNADLISNSLINYTHRDRHLRLEMPIGVAYGSDARKVEAMLLKIAQDNPRIARWPEPYVVFESLGDHAMIFELRVFMANVDNVLLIKSELNYAIEAAFREEGIDMPFPQQEVHWRDIDKLTAAIREAGRPG